MASEIRTYDAIVIGAGFSGMYVIKALRDKLGLKVRAYEAGETIGGTWYWNRNPASVFCVKAVKTRSPALERVRLK